MISFPRRKPLHRGHLLLLALASTSVAAQTAPTITLQGDGIADKVIPLDPLVPVTIASDGSMRAGCVVESGACSGIGPETVAPDKPTLTLTPSGATSVTAGNPINLSWTVSTGTDLCLASSSPTVSGWSNTVVPSSSTATNSRSVTLPSTGGPYALSLKCYDDDAGASPQRTATVTVNPGEVTPPPAGCDITSSDPNFQPANLTAVVGSWSDTFGSNFPVNNSYLAGLGTNVQTYRSFEFVAAANSYYTLKTYSAQPTPLNATAEPASGMVITISPCRGDFRAPVAAPPLSDPTLASACRKSAVSNNLTYGSVGCKLTAGQRYYLNITMKSSFQQVTNPADNTCNGTAYCELNASNEG